MNANAKDVFTDHLESALKRFTADRLRHKRLAFRLKLGTTILGAVATVLLGWESPGFFAPYLKNAALMATALITVLAAYDAFFEPRKLWVRETLVLNSLQDLKRLFQINSAIQEPNAEAIAGYSNQFNEILERSLDSWIKDKQIG